jgi:hypothetical protein
VAPVDDPRDNLHMFQWSSSASTTSDLRGQRPPCGRTHLVAHPEQDQPAKDDWGRAGELAPEQKRDRRRSSAEPGPATGAARGGAELAATRGRARSGAGARPEMQLGRAPYSDETELMKK